MFPQLPQQGPPGQVNANPGSPMNGAPQPSGGIPGQPPSTGAQLATGIEGFLNSYFGAQSAKKQHSEQQFFKSIGLIQQGLLTPKTADYEKIMKYARDADLPIRTEAPTPAEKQFQAIDSAASQAAQAPAPPRTMGGMPMPGMNPMLLAQGGPQGPPPGAPPPTMLQRMGRQFGIGRPPVSMDSPAAQMLQGVAQAAQGGAPFNPTNLQGEGELSTLKRNITKLGLNTSGMGMQQQQKMITIANQAMAGDDKAIEMAVRSGVLKDMPLDEYRQLARVTMPNADSSTVNNAAGQLYMNAKFGLPFQHMLMEMSDKLAPRYGGDVTAAYANLKQFMQTGQMTKLPGRTPEEVKQLGDAMSPLFTNYPTAPANLIGLAGMASLTGNNELYGKVLDGLSAYKRSGTISTEEFSKKFGQDQQRMVMENTIARDRLSFDVLDAIAKQGNEEYKEAWEKAKNAKSAEERFAAMQTMSSVDLKGSQVKVPIPGSKGPDGKPLMYTLRDPSKVNTDALSWWQQRTFKSLPPFTMPTGTSVPGQGQAAPFPTPGGYSYEDLMKRGVPPFGGGQGQPQPSDMDLIMQYINSTKQP